MLGQEWNMMCTNHRWAGCRIHTTVHTHFTCCWDLLCFCACPGCKLAQLVGNWGQLWCAWEGQAAGSAVWDIAWIQGHCTRGTQGGSSISASMLSGWLLEVNLCSPSLLLKSFCNLLFLCCLHACSQIGVDVLTAQGLVFYFCHSAFPLALLDQDGCLFSFTEPAIM